MTQRWRYRFLRSLWLFLLPMLIIVLAFSTTTVSGDRLWIFKPLANGVENTLFLPTIMGPPPISELEVTQGIQQPGNPVTLIANRPTFVRYTLTSDTAYSGVNAYLHGSQGGTPLPGSPISALNNPRTLEASANRYDINDTFNFNLPTSWASGTVELWGYAENGTDFEIAEGPITVSFSDNDPLPITVVPIAYTCTSGGSGTTTPGSPFDYLIDDAFKMYPVPSVDLSEHVSIPYSGPCDSGVPDPTYAPGPPYDDSDWERMLSQVTTVWQSEGSPNRYYYGLVEITCSGGCISGLGWLNFKVAVGFNGLGGGHDGASLTHAHEVGHNHGRHHAPGCGAGGTDPSFPYLDGSGRGVIGDIDNPNYGFDISTMDIMVYSSFYSFMSYCGPAWISDYNYEALFDWEVAQAPMMPKIMGDQHDALLVSGWLKGDGSVQLQPVYRLDIPTAPSDSGEYTLELLDGGGDRLAGHNFEIATAYTDRYGGASSGEIHGFHLTIPYIPGIEQINVVKDGEVLGELRSNPAPTSLLFEPPNVRIEGGELRVNLSAPAETSYLVRLSFDNGATWQTVAVNLKESMLHMPLDVTKTDAVRLEILASDGIHTKRIELGGTDITR